jgi:hypothetical protein
MDSSGADRIFFDTDALPERDRFPMYCEEIGRRYVGLDFRTQDPSRFSAKLILQRAGPVDTVHSSSVALDSIRTPQLVSDGDDSLCVVLLENGSGRQSQCGNDQKLVSHTAIICDAGYAGACNFITDVQFWSLRIRRRKIAGLLPRTTRFAGEKLDKDVTAQCLLFGYVHLLLEETGKSFTHHVLERRLERAVALLRDPQWRQRKIADIAAEAGLTDLSYFNRSFRRHFGATPSDFRAGGVAAEEAR